MSSDPRHSVRLSTDPTAQDVHQRTWLHRAKLTGIEELAVADRTRLVPHRPRSSIEHANHRCVAARTVDATLLVATRTGDRAGRIEQVDALLRVDVAILERVEPEALARGASVDVCSLDLHRRHRSPALRTLDLHECPHAKETQERRSAARVGQTEAKRPCAAS